MDEKTVVSFAAHSDAQTRGIQGMEGGGTWRRVWGVEAKGVAAGQGEDMDGVASGGVPEAALPDGHPWGGDRRGTPGNGS